MKESVNKLHFKCTDFNSSRPASTILDRESDRSIRWIKDTVYIRKEGWHSMNRDEGSYTVSHTHTTDFLPRHTATVARTGRRTEHASSDEGL